MVTGVGEDVVWEADPLVVAVVLSLQVPVPDKLTDVTTQADTNILSNGLKLGDMKSATADVLCVDALVSMLLGCASQLRTPVLQMRKK